MNDHERRARMAAEFTESFGEPPTHWTRAPGRVDLMGSHTDYNEGFILTMTIDRDTWLAARPRGDRRVRVRSLDMPGEALFGLDAIERNSAVPWSNYVRGVAQMLKAAGNRLAGFDGLLHTTIPVASGLSSSAALEMAVARMFEAVGDLQIDPVTLAKLCQRAENEFVGVNCGILDQYTSAMGKAGCALLLDARSVTSRDIPLAAGVQVVICDTGARRELTGSEYGERRAQCERGAQMLARIDPEVRALRDVSQALLAAQIHSLPDDVGRRSRFIVEENARVLALAEALPRGDREAIHTLTTSSFAGARDLFAITIPEMQVMEAAMLAAPGAIGARQAGAGFGGCMVAFVETAAAGIFAAQVAAAYASASGISPKIYAAVASTGAQSFEPA